MNPFKLTCARVPLMAGLIAATSALHLESIE